MALAVRDVWVIGYDHAQSMEWINKQERYLPAGEIMRPVQVPEMLRGFRGGRAFVLPGAGARVDFNAIMRELQIAETEIIWIVA